jgi:hypothetical protein
VNNALYPDPNLDPNPDHDSDHDPNKGNQRIQFPVSQA